MALSIEILSVCAGGNHLQAVITEDGAKPRSVTLTRDELRTVLSDSDKQALLVNTVRYHVEKGTAVEAITGKDIVSDAPVPKKDEPIK